MALVFRDRSALVFGENTIAGDVVGVGTAVDVEIADAVPATHTVHLATAVESEQALGITASVQITAQDLVTGAPAVGSPDMGQHHNIAAAALAPVPSLQSPTVFTFIDWVKQPPLDRDWVQ